MSTNRAPLAPESSKNIEMISPSPLTGSLLRTYNTIFQHPLSHNLKWRHVHALFRHLGKVEEEHNGNLKVTRNGESMILQPPRTKDVAEMEELVALRHFLERSETAESPAEDKGTHWLLVIDHHAARLFRSVMSGIIPQRLLAHEPDEHFGHAQDSRNFTRGKEKHAPNNFFEPVAKVLQAAGRLLIFGTGTGNSSEMDQFISWLKLHHPELAKRIVGSLVVDEHHLTDGELLARAREFYANHPSPLP